MWKPARRGTARGDYSDVMTVRKLIDLGVPAIELQGRTSSARPEQSPLMSRDGFCYLAVKSRGPRASRSGWQR
jgi:hypothetical protein